VTAPQRGNQRCVLGPPLGASDALHPPDQALAASVNLLRDNDREVGNGSRASKISRPRCMFSQSAPG
jgi:hypothetical protein